MPRSPDWTRWAVCCERWDVWKRESAKADWNGSEKVLLLYRAGRSVEQLAVNDGIRGSEDWTRPTGMPAGTFCCRISLGWRHWAVCRERWDVWKRESAKADWNGSEKVLLLYRAGRSVEQLAVNDGIRGSEDWTRPTGMPAGTFCCRISLGWRHWAVCRKRWECGKSEYWQRSAEMATRGVLLYKHRMGYPS